MHGHTALLTTRFWASVLVGLLFFGCNLWSHAAPVVTKAEYNQVHDGMSYREVQLIIGASGEEVDKIITVDTTTVLYIWENPDGSNMSATFQNGQLVNKAQFNLS